LKQKKAQTKECSKQVMVDGDILPQLTSEPDTLDAALETIPEEQAPHIQPWNIQKINPKICSFQSGQSPARRISDLYLLSSPYEAFELSDDWQLWFELPHQDGDGDKECNLGQPFPTRTLYVCLRRPE